MNANVLSIGSPGSRLPWWRDCLYGFCYWLAFLLVLEPGNVLRAAQMGYSLSLAHEAVRIVCASLLGTAVTPLVFAMARRFPLAGDDLWRRLGLHAAGAFGLAAGLVVASCVLAAWGFEGEWLPTLGTLRAELTANGLLLVFALAALIAIAHVLLSFRRGDTSQETIEPAARDASLLPRDLPTHVEIKHRTRVVNVSIASIDWVESQGNYVALHVGEAVHLLRETLSAFESQLDPAQFLRIHRRIIVRVSQARALKPLANGDASLLLVDGREVRVSRNYRERLARALSEAAERALA